MADNKVIPMVGGGTQEITGETEEQFDPTTGAPNTPTKVIPLNEQMDILRQIDKETQPAPKLNREQQLAILDEIAGKPRTLRAEIGPADTKIVKEQDPKQSVFKDRSASTFVQESGRSFLAGAKSQIPGLSIIPIGAKEDADLQKMYPYADTMGKFAGIAGTILATAPLEGAVAAQPVMRKLLYMGPEGSVAYKGGAYLARVLPKAVHFATTGFITSAAENAGKLARGETDVASAAKNIAGRTMEMAAFAIPSSLSKAAIRVGAQGLFGFSVAKLHGASTGQAMLEGALQVGLGLIDRSNLSENQKQLEYRRIMSNVNESMVKKAGMTYEVGINHAEAMIQQFPNTGAVFAELKGLRDSGRIIDASDDELQVLAGNIYNLWAKQMYNAQTQGIRPTLLSPSEIAGAREPGNPLDVELPEPVVEPPKPGEKPTTIVQEAPTKPTEPPEVTAAKAKGPTRARPKIVKPTPAEAPKIPSPMDVAIPTRKEKPTPMPKVKKPGHSHAPETVQDLHERGFTANEIKKVSPDGAKLIKEQDLNKGNSKITPQGQVVLLHASTPGISSPKQELATPPKFSKGDIVSFRGRFGRIVDTNQAGQAYVQFPDKERPVVISQANLVARSKRTSQATEIPIKKPSGYVPGTQQQRPQTPVMVTKNAGPVIDWINEKKKFTYGKFQGQSLNVQNLEKMLFRGCYQAIAGTPGMSALSQQQKDQIAEDAMVESKVLLFERHPDKSVDDWEKWLKTAINYITKQVISTMTVPKEFEQTQRSKRLISIASRVKKERFKQKFETYESEEVPADDDTKGISWKRMLEIREEYLKANPGLMMLLKNPSIRQQKAIEFVAFLAKQLEITSPQLLEIFEAMDGAASAKFMSFDTVPQSQEADEPDQNDPEVAQKIAESKRTGVDIDVPVEEEAMAKISKIPGEMPEIPATTGPHAIEMPELANLAKQLMGDYPEIKKLIKKWGYHKLGKIAIDEKVFKSPNFALYVLAHEIGHLDDWLSEIPRYATVRMRLLKLKQGIEKAFGPLEHMAQLLYFQEGVSISEFALKEELKNLSAWWNPFDEKKDPVYTKYRNSPNELKADFFSVLINNPDEAEARAPMACKLFWEHLEMNSPMAEALMELQDFLHLGPNEKHRVREMRIKKGYLKDKELFHLRRKEIASFKKNFSYFFYETFVDKNAAIIDKLRKLAKEGKKFRAEDDPRVQLQKRSFLGGVNMNTVEEVKDKVIDPLIQLGKDMEWAVENLGTYLQMNWVIQGRHDVANPGGHTLLTAKDYLEGMKEKEGEQNYAAIAKSAQALRQIVEAHLTRAKTAGLYTDLQFMKMMTANAYAPFQTLKHANEYISTRMIQITGTFDDIRNPFLVQVERLIALNNSIARNVEKVSIVQALKLFKDPTKEIQDAEEMTFQQGRRDFKPRPGWGLITTFEDGVFKGYYVDPYIENMLKLNSMHMNRSFAAWMQWANSSWFRPVLTGWDLGFQAIHNTRMYIRLLKIAPTSTLGDVILACRRAFPLAKEYIWGKTTPQEIKMMRDNGMLGMPFGRLYQVGDDEGQMEFLLKQYKIVKDTDTVVAPPGRLSWLKKPISGILDKFEELGNFFETHSRLMQYFVDKANQGKTGFSEAEIQKRVRWYGGSSSRVAGGSAHSWSNNLVLFFNDCVQGMRGDVLAGTEPKTRGGYWMRTFMINIVPKILLFMAIKGVFGEQIARAYKRVSEYRLRNYITIPLWDNVEDDMTLALQIPQDIVGRIIGGTFWEMLNFDPEDAFGSIQKVLKETKELLPITPAPLLEIPYNWVMYLTGGTPYDFREGQPILNVDEMRAGIKYSMPKMIQGTFAETGLYGLTDKRPVHSTLEAVLRWTPILKRFLIYTNAGLNQDPNIQQALKTKSEIKLRRREMRQSYS